MKLHSFLYFSIASLLFWSCNATNSEESSITQEKDTLKILSYNVHHCNPPEVEGLIDVEGIAALIKDIDADWVALQEIDINTGRSGGINQAKLLAEKSGYEFYHFSKTIDHDGGDYGILMLSKYPLTEIQTLKLPTDDTIGGEPRVLSTAIVKLSENISVLLANTHLDAERDNTSRMLQMNEILRIANESAVPFILAGDLNSEEDNEVISLLENQFVRSCTDCPDTFSEDGMVGTLDYVAFSPKDKFDVISHIVLDQVRLSDHFPVIVELKVK